MGVNGLWTVVQPCARPTNLATLNRKRLAVDASIWIYQFLKAVRDKEGNALRNSHVVGFFRRICKLLWYGIQPVFVFDGGAPALKRATIQARNRRREGRREDAARTAGKLLAVQMQRMAEEEEERRRKKGKEVLSNPQQQQQQPVDQDQEEELPDMNNVVYAGEMEMAPPQRQQARKFHKQDQYHLPELEGGSIAAMGKPEDPRIMSVAELEEYARQFNDGEDVNLYDFSKIDFDGDFFKSLPPPDRYNILNAARLRSRLRMGLSKEQLEEMFPDRMAFSRFQIERVRERNHLTQRLMYEVGMTGTDLTLGVNARIAGDKDREYILVKNEGAEGGWALGVVSKEKDVGAAHKPIDVDDIQVQYQSKDDVDDDEEDADFEDVPIEGVNRLPKPSAEFNAAQEIAARREQYYSTSHHDRLNADTEDSLFVGGNTGETVNIPDETAGTQGMHPEEEDELNRAIALSLQSQHGVGLEEEFGVESEGERVTPAPEWVQRSVEPARPIFGTGGSAIAHVVNNRANATVSKQQESVAPPAHQVNNDSGSDSDDDMQAVLARSRKKRKEQQPKPVLENKKNPFDGPLPFPKLDWRSSLFASGQDGKPQDAKAGQDEADVVDDDAGGFEKEKEDERPVLPPWLADETDIRESIRKQQDLDRDFNAEDKAQAEEEERLRQRRMRDAMIEVESSDSESDVEIIDKPPSPKPVAKALEPPKEEIVTQEPAATDTTPAGVDKEDAASSPEPEFEDVQAPENDEGMASLRIDKEASASPEPVFEDVPGASADPVHEAPKIDEEGYEVIEDVPQDHQPDTTTAKDDDDLFGGGAEFDEFSDSEDEELMAQMAEESEEHARFASELNNKSAEQNREDYEKELRQLRSQQKKDRRDADEVTQVMVGECQALLRLFGIPYITAPMEAEAQCAELVTLGLVDGIVTDDSDTFLFGGTRVYKNMFNTNKFVECYLASDLEKELSLSRPQLISLAQLLGSDYTEGLPGVGPVTAVEILSEFPGPKGLDDFREWWLSVQAQTRSKDEDASSPFRKKFRKSQGTKLFLPTGFPSSAVYDAYLNPEVDDSAEVFQWGVPDLEGLRRFLMATIGWSKERTDEVLVPVIRDMNKRDVEGTQSNITRFFDGSVGAGARDAYAPRQRTQGSKRMLAAVDRLRTNAGGQSGAAEAGGSSDESRKRKRRTRTDK